MKNQSHVNKKITLYLLANESSKKNKTNYMVQLKMHMSMSALGILLNLDFTKYKKYNQEIYIGI